MSYEKKMKKLMERMVAMTPEPPPYPEEITVSTATPRRKPRPVLAFVGAAALVALLAIPAVLFMRGDPGTLAETTTTSVPGETTTTAMPETTTTAGPETTTTAPDETTTPTEPVESVWSSVVFLYQNPEDSFGGNPALVPVWLEVADESGSLSPDDEFTDVLGAIGSNLPPGLENGIPSDVRVVGLSSAGSTSGDEMWIADMNEAFLAGAGGLLADFTMLNQLIYTIIGSTTIDRVLFTVNGEPVDAFGSEGLILTDPVGRDSFIDNLAPAFLTEPLVESDGVYTVAGMANVFEAMVTIDVIDADGSTTYEAHTMATSGSGEWGEYSEAIPAEQITPGASSVRVFTYSMEDGSRVDIVTVPIPEARVWRITIDG